MFNVEQRASVTDEGRPSLAPMLFWLFSAYAGLSTGIAGFVLNRTELVVVGLLLVMSGSALAKFITKVTHHQGDELFPAGVARLPSEG